MATRWLQKCGLSYDTSAAGPCCLAGGTGTDKNRDLLVELVPGGTFFQCRHLGVRVSDENAIEPPPCLANSSVHVEENRLRTCLHTPLLRRRRLVLFSVVDSEVSDVPRSLCLNFRFFGGQQLSMSALDVILFCTCNIVLYVGHLLI